MAQPMGAPAAPEAAAPAGGAPDQGGSTAKKFQMAVSNTSDFLAQAADAAGQVNPAAAQMFQQANQLLQKGMEALMGGGGGEAPASSGVSTPEQGGAAGAVPASPAGVRR